MKEGWIKKRIDEVCSIARGGSPRPIKDYITNDSNGLNWIKIGDTDMGGKYIYSTKEKIKPEGLKKSRWVEEDEFLLSNSMSFGRPYILKTNGCIHDGWLVLREYQKYLNIDFFYYVLSSEYVQRQFRTKAQGSTVSNLNTDRVASVTIPVPPLSEQQSIVDYLDSAFAKIDAMKANAEKALNEAKALFQASLKEMLEPKEGWEEKILQDICSEIVDCPHTTPPKVSFPTQYPCIRTSELKGGCIDWSTMQYLDENEYLKRVSRLVPKANDIVYGREGTYGDAVLLPEGYNFSLGQRTMLLRPNEIYIIPRFLLYSMISSHVYQQAKAKNSGCGVGHVNVKDIKLFKIGIPTIFIQQSIVTTLDSLKSKVDRLQENYDNISQECDALKQAILRQVFE